MTRIKFCGMTRREDIDAANRLRPEYIGFVFASKSSRYITPEEARRLRQRLDGSIRTVGVFVQEPVEKVAGLINSGVIDIAQLHGGESEEYVKRLRQLTGGIIIKAFRIRTPEDVREAEESSADHILLDSGAGTGKLFDWDLLQGIRRPYFLAGGLDPENARAAVSLLQPFAVDVSSGIETDGVKDEGKMAAFAEAVRAADAGSSAETEAEESKEAAAFAEVVRKEGRP